MKGILLAGGSGTRLYPLTKAISKHMLPIYNKPMIFYPLSVLMLAGIKDILIISTPADTQRFKQLLGNGEEIGISLTYAIQQKPEGIAQAFIIGEKFIAGEPVALILGDNIFYGERLSSLLRQAAFKEKGATVFACYVGNPQEFGVIEWDKEGKAITIEEKPINPKSSYAVTGLYFYDNRVIDFANKINPSKRGELEITDINNLYLQSGDLYVELLNEDVAWLDTGTHNTLLEASNIIESLEKSKKQKIACIEEIAYKLGFIDRNQLLYLAKQVKSNEYGTYLMNLLEERKEE
ncbi:glucose-1-phosphate thymidylyltransferase RfbA [Bacillus mesophilum]|uniref:Glucose-1-phosphate thymidylyltransferase n=1 Tax=Bacillus mesophilum TaxID=1071718 RepID=A0A7V7RQA3_9BACI|nr:glucose-1-phosphate thymidylyltransferase RfbA [Bacillus mesophilum]KAB2335579.1 glucose-1-phosphate thymidylyltransferase RfbA [Bacillus mesophilum]